MLTLPAAPNGKIGWPWTGTHTAVTGGEWPRITIVTPNFNQGRFIERMFRSIHGQSYPNLEHIVIDAASTDESLAVIRRYESLLYYWVSEKDRGQTHGINKGLERATGEIVNWVNADDILYDGALFEVARAWKADRPHLFIGASVDVDVDGRELKRNLPRLRENPLWLMAYWESVVPQPSTFFSRSLLQSVGPLDEKMNYRMDWEFYLRAISHLGKELRIAKTDVFLSEITYHADCKSMNSSTGFNAEAIAVWRKLMPRLPLSFRVRARLWLNWFESMDKVEAGRAKGRGYLLWRVLSDPKTWPYRFTWGALKQSLFP
ncbi:MAG: glycosyltransferase [Deltaproteobacteria bacterium]|nr:glycosyltransferase [Deltaproteobacteria bacterium]